jgi:hemolysin III
MNMSSVNENTINEELVNEESINEKRANVISHGIGASLSIAAFILLVQQSANTGSAPHIISSILYGSALVLLYICSTLLHGSSQPHWIDWFETLDHAAIYLLIAGTFTPFLLILLQGLLGWSMLMLIWLLAIGGLLMKLLHPGKYMGLSLILYMVMGWLIVPLIPSLRQVLPSEGMLCLLLGFGMYCFGSIFYFWRGIRYHHAIWHVFVLGGSFCHFIAIYRFVLPFSR